MPKGPFQLDMEKIRESARAKMEEGAVTQAYKADREQVIAVLNDALATELVCILRYKNHYFMAKGIRAEIVAAEMLEHAQDEQLHADQIAERITQLGGEPNFNPEGLHTRAHSDYVEGGDLKAMLREDLFAERIAVQTYSEIIRWLGDDDPTTRMTMQEILKKEEEHADDLSGLLEEIDSV